jgi:hypothetical protein
MKTTTYKHIALFILLGVIFSCKPSDYYYSDFLKGSEIYYPGRIDSLSIIPGDQRAQLRFRASSDPKIVAVKVYLRNSLSPSQSVHEFPINSGDHGNFKLINFDELQEATYTANVYSISNTGDSSQFVSASQFIYGQAYNRTLVNRIVARIDKADPSKQYIVFNRESNLPKEGTFYPMQFTEVEYETLDGGTNMIKLTPYQEFGSIENIANSTKIKYRTAYKPVANSIDYFYTDYNEIEYNK